METKPYCRYGSDMKAEWKRREAKWERRETLFEEEGGEGLNGRERREKKTEEE